MPVNTAKVAGADWQVLPRAAGRPSTSTTTTRISYSRRAGSDTPTVRRRSVLRRLARVASQRRRRLQRVRRDRGEGGRGVVVVVGGYGREGGAEGVLQGGDGGGGVGRGRGRGRVGCWRDEAEGLAGLGAVSLRGWVCRGLRSWLVARWWRWSRMAEGVRMTQGCGWNCFFG